MPLLPLPHTRVNHDSLMEDYSEAIELNTRELAGAVETTPSISVLNTVIYGQDEGGNYVQVPVGSEGALQISLVNPSTAFGDLRTAGLTPIVQLTFPVCNNTDIIVPSSSGTATLVSDFANGLVVLEATAASDFVGFVSRQPVKYRPGLGILSRFTAIFSDMTATEQSQQYIGLGDENDGFFFARVWNAGSAQMAVVRRQDGVDYPIYQSAWNIDRMDGTGTVNPSGMDLTPSFINVYQIQSQWLGAGQIEFSIENRTTGKFTVVHRIQYTNQNTRASVFNPTFPLYMRVAKTLGSGASQSLKTASMAGFVEGPSIPTGPVNPWTGNIVLSGAAGSESVVMSLQNNSTFPAGQANRITALFKTMTAGGGASGSSFYSVHVNIYRNATFTGTPTWTDTKPGVSVMRYDAGVTTITFDTSKRVYSVTTNLYSLTEIDLSKINFILRPGEHITFSVKIIRAQSNPDFGITVLWQEDF